MTTSEFDRSELARQGDSNEIADLLNQQLPPEITVKAAFKDGCLKVMLEAAEVPDQSALVELVRQVLIALNAESIRQVKVYGREQGDDFPHWQDAFELTSPSNSSSIPTELNSSESVAPVEPTPPVAQARNFWETMMGTLTGATGAVGGAAVTASTAVAGTVAGAAGAASHAAVQAGGAIAGTAIGVAGAVGNTAIQATDGVGYVLDLITHSPQLQELTRALQVDWLLAIVNKVDIVQAAAQVQHLQHQYPHDKPSEIAHRIILEKAFYVGASGFASSLMPGFAAAMFTVDLVATMALQAEMTYQIAGAYGFDMQEPARKGEVLAIFGIALGSNAALKAGLGVARNLPVAGAVIGASSNAAMLYALGYAAGRFYEAKLASGSSSVDPSAAQAESEAYLEDVLDQQIILDQILLHLVLAGHPGQTLQQLLPELQQLNLNSGSLNSITANSQELPPLETLLDSLSQDFAVSLLAQCEQVAQADGVITPQEAEVMHTITEKFSATSLLTKER